MVPGTYSTHFQNVAVIQLKNSHFVVDGARLRQQVLDQRASTCLRIHVQYVYSHYINPRDCSVGERSALNWQHDIAVVDNDIAWISPLLAIIFAVELRRMKCQVTHMVSRLVNKFANNSYLLNRFITYTSPQSGHVLFSVKSATCQSLRRSAAAAAVAVHRDAISLSCTQWSTHLRPESLKKVTPCSEEIYFTIHTCDLPERPHGKVPVVISASNQRPFD